MSRTLNMFKPGLMLLMVAAAAAFILGLVNLGTAGRIAAIAEETMNSAMQTVLPAASYTEADVEDDGEVEANFLQAKQVLDYLKKFCSGQKTVAKDLAEVFNAETKHGKRMEKYSALLQKSIEDLIGKKQEVGVASLFTKGGTAMPQSYDDGMADFELVAFVVLK